MQTVPFNLHYEVDRGSEDGKASAWRTVAAFEFPNNDLPNFSITKSGFLSRCAPHKVNIDGNPEFSERFVVNGKEQTAVQDLLKPRFFQSMVSTRQSEKLVIEGAGLWLILYRMGRRIRPEQWQEFLDETSTMASAFARYCAAHQNRQRVPDPSPTQHRQSA